MLGVREAMALDIDAIIAQALRTHTALEINAQPLRLDLNDIHIRQAVDAGVKLIINTDAHDTAGLKLMRFGAATAQRGWAKKTDILNCHGVSVIRDWVKDKRKKHKP
jgi:DNA polymerase (family 10)